MKKTIAFLLAVLMLAAVCVSCANDPSPEPSDETTAAPEANNTTEAAVSEAPAVTNSIPESVRYDGETIAFVSRDADYVRDELTVEDDSGDILQSAISRRTADIENRFGIKIDNTKLTGNNYVVTKALQTAVSTSEHLYDIIANSCYSTIMYTSEGLFYDLNQLQYLDLSAPYWSQGFNDVASLGSSQYMCTGAASLALYRLMFVTFFNRDLLVTLNEESLFDVVKDGRWTLDYQIALGKDHYSDKDGSMSISEGDTVGLATSTLVYIDPYWSSCMNPILSKNADNWFDYSIDVERLSTTLEKVISLFYDANSYIVTSGSDSERQNSVGKVFASGSAITATLRLCASEDDNLRDMSDKYGVIPMPKLNEEQSEYRTFLHDQFTAFAVCHPVDDDRAEMLGAVLEYMAYSSYLNVVPVYYNVALKSKYMQDTASWDMLDMIYEKIYIDGGVLYTKKLNDVHQTPRTIVTSKQNSTAAYYKRLKSAVTLSLTSLQDAIQKMQDAAK